METKICNTCEIEKPILDFHKHKVGKRVTKCKQCMSEYKKSYYIINKQADITGSDIRVLDTMIEIYKEKGFNNITDAFKSIGKKELKELAYKRLGKCKQ